MNMAVFQHKSEMFLLSMLLAVALLFVTLSAEDIEHQGVAWVTVHCACLCLFLLCFVMTCVKVKSACALLMFQRGNS